MLQFCRRLWRRIPSPWRPAPPSGTPVAENDEPDAPAAELSQEYFANLRLEYERTLDSFYRSETMVYAGVVFLITIAGTALALIVRMDAGEKQVACAIGTFVLVTIALISTKTWAERQYTVNDLRAFRIRQLERQLGLWSNRFIHLMDVQLDTKDALPAELQAYVDDGHRIEKESRWGAIAGLLLDPFRGPRKRYLATRRREANVLLYFLGFIAWGMLIVFTLIGWIRVDHSAQQVPIVEPTSTQGQSVTPAPTITYTLTPVVPTPPTSARP